MKKYKTILADPPWSYKNKKTGVVILTNVGATNNTKRKFIDQLCFYLLNEMG